jgi:hypothetical protein
MCLLHRYPALSEIHVTIVFAYFILNANIYEITMSLA